MLKNQVVFETVGELSRAGYHHVSTKTASEKFGKHPRTIRRWADEGKLIAVKENGFWRVVPELIKECPPSGRHDTS